jgi:imidazolonepropionase
VELVPTFLGAHVVPREFGDRRGAYLDLLVHELLPEVARQGLAEACDVFCDQGAFTLDEARRVLEAALALGLKPKVHAEQLSNTGAVQLACELGALSADHLEQASAEDVARLARSNTVPVLLPGSSVFLGRQRHAPGRALCDAGARPAVSTDCNPGSANTTNLALVATLAVTLCGLTVAEALAGVTREAARALGRGDRLGTVEVGKQADLALFDVPSYPWILYEFGQLRVARVMKGGEWV